MIIFIFIHVESLNKVENTISFIPKISNQYNFNLNTTPKNHCMIMKSLTSVFTSNYNYPHKYKKIDVLFIKKWESYPNTSHFHK